MFSAADERFPRDHPKEPPQVRRRRRAGQPGGEPLIAAPTPPRGCRRRSRPPGCSAWPIRLRSSRTA